MNKMRKRGIGKRGIALIDLLIYIILGVAFIVIVVFILYPEVFGKLQGVINTIKNLFRFR